MSLTNLSRPALARRLLPVRPSRDWNSMRTLADKNVAGPTTPAQLTGGWLMRRLKGERGASLVEFAFVLPILVTLVFGIVEFGISYNNYISLRQGAREGARMAVVGNFGTNNTCTMTGSTPASDTKLLACLTKDRIGTLDASTVRFKLAFPDTAGTYTTGDRVRICAQYKLSSATGFPLFSAFMNNKKLSTKVDMRIEQVPSGSNLSAYEETSLTGSWECS